MPPPEQPASKKAKTTVTTETTTATDSDAPKKGRGRPPKATKEPDTATTTNDDALKKGRGRPPKAAQEPETAARKPGRPTKATAKGKDKKKDVARRTSRRTSEMKPEFHHDDLPGYKRRSVSAEDDDDEDDDDNDDEVAVEDKSEPEPEPQPETAPEPKKRGRPAQGKGKATAKPEKPSPDTAALSGRRGRATAIVEVESPAPDEPVAPAERRRGRPSRKAKEEVVDEEAQEEVPHRAHTHFQHVEVEKQLEEELAEAVEEEEESKPAPAIKANGKRKAAAAAPRKGAKKAKKSATATTAAEEDDVDMSNEANATEATTVIANDTDGMNSSDRQYWLLKAEPESRIELNKYTKSEHNVKFTIDDLRAATSPEPWEGIRNMEAQKNMKAMKVGDLAFFYESNTKKPGIVGIMEIVQTATPDPTAFDKKALYYDEKSDPKKPKWMLVHVKFIRKFDKITLKVLQSFGKDGGVLHGMDLINRGRLSVGKVTPSQWTFIMGLVKDEDEDEDVAANADGAVDDRGMDFASAFEAPENLGVPNHESAADDPMSDVEVPAATDEEVNEEPTGGAATTPGPFTPDPMPTATEPSSNTKMGESANIFSGILESMETAAEAVTNSVVETATGLFPGKRAAGSRAGSVKADSRAGSVKAGSRAGSAAPRAVSRARSAARESVKGVADVVMQQSETILEEA